MLLSTLVRVRSAAEAGVGVDAHSFRGTRDRTEIPGSRAAILHCRHAVRPDLLAERLGIARTLAHCSVAVADRTRNDQRVTSRTQPPPLTALSPREREVIAGVALGLNNRQVAERLDVSVHAVKFHLASIFRKLGVANRTQAAATYLTAHDGAAQNVGEG